MRWNIPTDIRIFKSRNLGLTVRIMQRWLHEIQYTLEKLRRDFDDFTRLAGREDEDYRLNSPWYNQGKENEKTKQFDIERLGIGSTEPSRPPKAPGAWHANKSRLKMAGRATKWAIWDKDKWETAVGKFQKRNAKLRDALQMGQATQQQQVAGTLADLRNNVDANRLGLTVHAELRRIVDKPDSSDVDLDLKNGVLFSHKESPTIHIGTYEEDLAKGNPMSESVLIEYKDYPPLMQGLTPAEIKETKTRIASRVHQLASLLFYSGSSELGTLPIRGIVDQPSKSRHGFVFDFPAGAEICSPETLHSIMKSPSPNSLWPLAKRFSIAQSIAKSIGKFHADGWVHKSLRSQSVVFFQDREDKSGLLDATYLVDFEYSRPESGTTFHVRDNDEEKNLYRHPDIQDLATSSFSKLHDIYSLGVVLLEIALWQTARSMLDELKKRNKQHSDEEVNAHGLQEWYVSRAKKKVAHLMGTSYQSAVLVCLGSKYKDQTRRRDFPTLFFTQVTQKLSPKQIV